MTTSSPQVLQAPNDEYSSGLFPQHVAKLASSGISPEVARQRDYRTADSKAALRRIGFSDAQRRVPALVIPLTGVTGEVVGFQCRPDEPRVHEGRIVKYETVVGQRMVLDIPRRSLPMLGDPSIPLFITEGPIKADSAVSHGLCCVDVCGVWSWRGTNDRGGKLPCRTGSRSRSIGGSI